MRRWLMLGVRAYGGKRVHVQGERVTCLHSGWWGQLVRRVTQFTLEGQDRSVVRPFRLIAGSGELCQIDWVRQVCASTS